MLVPDKQGTGPPQPDQVFPVEQSSIDATTAWDVRPALLRALYTRGPQLWVDLSRVEFIDSTGLGMLVGVLKEAREMDGDLQLINASGGVQRILQVTGLEALFAVHTYREGEIGSPGTCGVDCPEGGDVR